MSATERAAQFDAYLTPPVRLSHSRRYHNEWSADRSVRRFLTRLPNSGVALWDCWRVTTRRADGYATFGERQLASELYAHRIVAALLWGPIPPGFEVDHLCHHADPTCRLGNRCPHRSCVNPLHLRVCRLGENREDRRWEPKTHCPAGHEYAVDGRTKQGRCRPCSRAATRAWLDQPGNRERQNAMRNARRAKALVPVVPRRIAS